MALVHDRALVGRMREPEEVTELVGEDLRHRDRREHDEPAPVFAVPVHAADLFAEMKKREF